MTQAERAALSVGGTAATGSDLQFVESKGDSLEGTHVRFNQFYQGLRVFGAQIVVHMNAHGITGVNGDYVPDVSLDTTPALSAASAAQIAVATARKTAGAADLSARQPEMSIYPTGLLEGFRVQSVLAYAVEVSGGGEARANLGGRPERSDPNPHPAASRCAAQNHLFSAVRSGESRTLHPT